MTTELYDRGHFEGEVLARLKTIESNQAEVWVEIKTQRAELKVMNDRLEQARGAIVVGKAIWGVTGAVIAAIGVWFSHKGAKP